MTAAMDGQSELVDILGRLALFADFTRPELEAVAHTVDEVLGHLDEPDETHKALDDFRHKLEDEVAKGKISKEDAQRLSAAIDRLAATLSQGQSEGD